MKCHARAGCAPARDRGSFGWLCDACFDDLARVLAKKGINILGSAAAKPSATADVVRLQSVILAGDFEVVIAKP